MSDLQQRRCRGHTCRAALLMAPTMNGKTIPLDAEPDEAGNVVLHTDMLGGTFAVVLNDGDATRARDRGDRLYMPHHASCPDVEEFRHA